MFRDFVRVPSFKNELYALTSFARNSRVAPPLPLSRSTEYLIVSILVVVWQVMLRVVLFYIENSALNNFENPNSTVPRALVDDPLRSPVTSYAPNKLEI